MELAKIGDTIEWEIKDGNPAIVGIYQAEVVGIADEEDYMVMAEYGPDFIPFEIARIIKQK